jgi:hypothetical protein
LCAALVWAAAGRVRLVGLVGPAIALVMWIATNDGHGVLFTEGFVLGLLLWSALRALRIAGPLDAPVAPEPLSAPDSAAGRRPTAFERVA